MPHYSKESLARLATCARPLQWVFDTVIEHWDNTILVGHRGKEDQDKAVAEGRSKTPWPTSEHNSEPSKAVDAAPYYADVPNGGIDWRTDAELMAAIKQGDMALVKTILENIKRWMAFSGFVRGVAAAKGIHLRSGADWDNDQRFNDQTLIDLPHFELLDPSSS